jgi:hypothetical protein
VSRRGSRALAAAALALSAAAPARALEVSGSVAAGYERSDARSPGFSSSVPGWDFGGQLQLSDAPFRPGLLRYSGSAEYRQQRTLYSEGTTRSDNILYGASADLFSNSPLALSLSKARTRIDFTGSLEARDTGTTFADTSVAAATLRLQHMPTLRASFVLSDFESERFGSRSVTGARELDLGAQQVVGPLRYTAAYDSDWNTGTFAATNFRAHHVVFDSTFQVGPDSEVLISDNYFLRLPTVDAATNPRVDDNAFNGSVRWRPSARLQLGGAYVAQRSTAEISGSADRQALADALSSSADYRLTERLSLNGSVGAARIEQQLGDTPLKQTNEFIATGARWQDRLGIFTYGVGGTTSFALVQSDEEGRSGIGRGLGGNVTFDAVADRWNSGLSYDLSQARDVGTVAGSAFTHTLGGHAEYIHHRASRLRWTAQLNHARREAPLFGDATTRNATTALIYSWRRYSTQLQAGYTNGFSTAATRIDSTGAIILPPEFASRTRHVSLTAIGPLRPNLWVTGIGRMLWADIPGLPQQQETGFSVVADYRIGAVTVSAEERYTTTDLTGYSTSANLFLLRVSRNFGAHF